MRKISLILILVFFAARINAQEKVDPKSLGLAGYLTYVKGLSEYKMKSLSEDANYKSMPDKAKQFNSEYNLIKLSVDQLINQLSSDLFKSNRLRLFKRLDNYLNYKTPMPKKFAHYQLLLDQIDGQLTAFLIKKYQGGALAGPSIEEITGIVSEGREIITSARDFREKKIQSLHTLVKDLRLVNLAEIVSPKKKDE